MIVAGLAIIATAILVPWFRYSLRVSREAAREDTPCP